MGMRKKIVLLALMVMLCFSVALNTVSADMGPKPSVHVSFTGIGDKVCYATLLSKNRSTGPASAWDGLEEHANYGKDLNEELWKAFVEYKDEDGFYFLQNAWNVSDTDELDWTYHPPSPFKVLLYFPQTQTFVVSDICKRYAFDSYFTVNLQDENIQGVSIKSVKKSYDYTWEIVSLLARIVITVLLEIGIALLFRYISKKQLLVIGVVNMVTQIVLNVLLNIVNYRDGELAFMLSYFLWEFIVFIIEAVVYAIFLARLDERKNAKTRAIFYAFIANVVSFIAGFGIAILIPGIF